MIKKYIKKPIIVEAIEFKGTNWYECESFISNENFKLMNPIPYKKKIHIPIIGGIVIVETGDFIIKGINGKYSSCKPDIFKENYEEK